MIANFEHPEGVGVGRIDYAFRPTDHDIRCDAASFARRSNYPWVIVKFGNKTQKVLWDYGTVPA